MTFDQGLGVTEIKTPSIAGTQNYKYTVTYADGSKSEGQVDAGKVIEAANGKIITSIDISPDLFEQNQGTAETMPSNNFADQSQDSSTNAFLVYGAVNSTVASGTNLNSNISFSGQIKQGNQTLTLSSKSQTLTQKVIAAADLTSSSYLWSSQTSTAAGHNKAAVLSVYSSNPMKPNLTNNIYEPIFYYVLPEWFAASNFSTDYTKLDDFQPNSNNGVTGKPKLSIFAVPTGISGLSRQVVKIDYSGTGYNFLAGQGANNKIWMNSLSDAPNGKYQGMIYVVSPTTKLTNTAYDNSTKNSGFAPAGIQFNSDWVQGNTNNLYYIGAQTFTINQVGGAKTASTAQGNQNDILLDFATSDIYGSNQMKYAVRISNESNSDSNQVVALINLPQASDNNSFTFQLTGRPVYDGDKTGYTFLYSTKTGNLGNSTDDGYRPDDSDYYTADEVTAANNWKNIKSIIVKTATLKSGQRSDRLIFTGIDPNFVTDAGKVGYLDTGFYSSTTKPFIISKELYLSNTSNGIPGNITVNGQATINYRLHYKDASGQDQYIDLPNMSQTYDLSKKQNKMPSEQEVIDSAKVNTTVTSQLPSGYEIGFAIIQAGPKSWQTDDPAGTPEFGQPVAYYYNNATVTLEAVPIQKTITFQVIDENDPNNPITITSPTNLVTGNEGDTVPAGAQDAYNKVQQDLVDKGYVISDKSSSFPSKFGPTNETNDFTIYVTHGTTRVTNPSEWPSDVPTSYQVALSKDITRTVTVKGLPESSNVNGTTQTVTYTRTAVVDNVTHEVVGYVDPSNTDQTIKNGDAAWTSKDNNWAAFTPANVPDGYSISTITDANGNYADVTKVDGNLTGLAQVSVPSNGSNVNVTITYQGNEVSNTITFVDADNNNDVVGTPTTINGRVGETQDLNLTIPDGYTLPDGLTLPTSYTFKAINQEIVIPLVHKKVKVGPKDTWPSSSQDTDKVPLSKTISRTINVSGLPTIVAPTTQNVTFTRTAIVDEVTGKVVGYVDPSNSSQTVTDGEQAWKKPAKSSWDTWTNSVPVPEGYYISSVKVNNSDYADVTKDQNGMITGLNSVPVTSGTVSVVVNVEYAPVDLNLTISHDPVTNTYNGNPQPVSTDVINAITHTVESSNQNVAVNTIADDISKAGLTADDYSYTDSEGNVLKDANGKAIAPTAVGNYRIILNDSGLAKLQQLTGLTIKYDPTKSYVNYKIVAADATVQLAGSNSKTYNGTAVTTNDLSNGGSIKVTVNYLGKDHTYTLQNGDYTWSTANREAPTNVGSYSLKLTDAGMDNIQYQINGENGGRGNVTIITQTDGSGSASFDINPASISISGTGTQTHTYDGQTPTIDPSNFPINLKSDDAHVPTIPDGTLDSSDFVIKDQDGNTVTPTGHGSYDVYLTPGGIAKLKTLNPNFRWPTTDQKVGTLNINAATPSATFSGQGSKTYDGKAIDGYQPTITITAPGQNSVSLIAGTDYVWTKDGQSYTKAPADAGDYKVVLTPDGINKVKAVNAQNLDWTNVAISQNARYTINRATATVTFNGKGQSVDYTGKTGQFKAGNFPINISTDNKLTLNVPDGTNLSVADGDFVFTDSKNNKATTEPTDLGTYTVALSDHGFQKLQSQTNNYNWLNHTSGTYTISKATNIPVTLTNVGNGQQEIYTGKTFSNNDLNPNDYKVQLGNGKTYTLVAGDLEFVPDQDPTNVGTYQVQLSKQGKDHISALDPTHHSYDFSNAGTGSFEITQAQATANLSGHAFKTYDGNHVTTKELNDKDSNGSTIVVTISIPNSDVTVTYYLQDGDYTWDTPDGKAPVNAGDNYTIKLSPSGLANLQNAINDKWGNGNVTITSNDLKGHATFTIKKANITISGTGTQKYTYDGKTPTIDPSQFPITLMPEANAPVPTIPEGTLKSSDFVAKDKNGNGITSNKGDYTVYLTPDGIAKLQQLYPNYNWPSTDQAVGTLSIVPAKMTVTMSGSDSKNSDGQPASVDSSTLINDLTPDKLPADKLNKSGLTLDDFTWSTSDGKAPSTVGTYHISLNENGLAKLQANNPNYDITVSGNFTYTIDPATQTVEYVDENGNVVKTIDNIAGDATNYDDTVSFNAQDNLPTNYDLVDPSQATTDITVENGTTKIKVKAATETTTETRTITRTIVITMPDGSQTTIPQKVVFTRTVTTNKVNGNKTYGPWNQSTATWDEYTPNPIKGYSIPNVPAETVTPDTTDKTVTIAYTKNPVKLDHPVTPINPNQPTKPGHQPGSNSQNNGNANNTANSAKGQKQGNLPQTGDSHSEMGVLGLGLLSMVGLLGLRKKKED